MSDIMPRKVAHRSDRGLAASIIGAAVTFAVHAFDLLGWHYSLMVYMAFLSAAIACGTASALARCHMAIASAFAAGLRVGQSAPTPPAAQRHAGLRAVD